MIWPKDLNKQLCGKLVDDLCHMAWAAAHDLAAWTVTKITVRIISPATGKPEEVVQLLELHSSKLP